MAKKSSSNAVKKIDEQIDKIKKSSKKHSKDDKTIVVSKSELKKGIEKVTKQNSKAVETTSKSSKSSTSKSRNVRDKVIVAPKKKTTTAKKSTKNVRSKVVVVPKKNTNNKIRSKKGSNKQVRDKVVVTPLKKSDDKLLEEEFVVDSKVKALEIEEDITNGKYIDAAKALINKNDTPSKKVKRKRKGKNKYVIDIKSSKEYDSLEKDLRSLYEKTNDIIDDIDNKKVEDKLPEKSIKLIDEVVVADSSINKEKKSLLDLISQKFLNITILVLLIIFTIMLIGVIAFIIFVSTF